MVTVNWRGGAACSLHAVYGVTSIPSCSHTAPPEALGEVAMAYGH